VFQHYAPEVQELLTCSVVIHGHKETVCFCDKVSRPSHLKILHWHVASLGEFAIDRKRSLGLLGTGVGNAVSQVSVSVVFTSVLVV
jgi:hypothetical protein